MKTINILLILFSISFINHIDAQQDTWRPVIWLHGLGGNEYSWDKAIDAVEGLSSVSGFPAREALTLRLTYSENGLQTAASTLNQALNDKISANVGANNTYSYNQYFFIAHSQGGLTARMLDYLYQPGKLFHGNTKKFGGIVTFGTPHGGAYILNSVMNGDHEDFITNACIDVIAGPLAEAIESNLILRILGNLFSYQDKHMMLCEQLPDIALTTFLESYTQPITSDYAVGASTLQSLNSYNHPGIHKVAFYSEEDDPVFWRLVTHLIDEPNTFPSFGANSDQQMVDDANYNYNYAYNMLVYNIAERTQCNVFCGSWDDKIDAWEKTVDFWENINEKWEVIIGATSQYLYQGYCTCIIRTPEGYLDGVTYNESDPANCITYESLPDHEECYPTYGYETVDFKSDGVVLEESAKAFPGAHEVKLLGSNHQQMRNDDNTKDALYELFEGDHGTYFITDIK